MRWLVSPHTAKAAAQKAVTYAALAAGRIITLIGTHWSDADATRSGGCFANASVVQSPAGGGPQGGRQGGVAVMVPAGYTSLDFSEIVPGCALIDRVQDTNSGDRGRPCA